MPVFSAFVHFLFQIGYFGPFLMGILDSSFLVLPFGNDMLVAGMVARDHQGIPWYVLSAACGSSVGAAALALVSRKLGEEGIRKIAGGARYAKLKSRVGHRLGIAIAVAGLAPPPFPFTTVIAAAAALGYPLWKMLLINFLARAARFAILSMLAVKFGRHILRIVQSPRFEWAMAAFIVLCIFASAFSAARWLRKPKTRSVATQTAA